MKWGGKLLRVEFRSSVSDSAFFFFGKYTIFTDHCNCFKTILDKAKIVFPILRRQEFLNFNCVGVCLFFKDKPSKKYLFTHLKISLCLLKILL